MLSLLVLLAATLAYTSKLELITSKNFGRGVQNQTAALTGVQFAAATAGLTIPEGAVGNLDMTFDARALDGAMLAALQDQRLSGSSASKKDDGPMKSLPPGRTRVGIDTQTSSVSVSDLSGRVNVNVADATTLEAVIGLAAGESSLGADASGIAARMVAWRYGPDGAPGKKGVDDNRNSKDAIGAKAEGALALAGAGTSLATSPDAPERLRTGCDPDVASRLAFVGLLESQIDEPEEYVADLRQPPFGDDRRFQALTDLLQIEGVTPDLVRALQPYVTVFSISLEQRPSSGGQGDSLSLLDLNRATAEEIHKALAEEYGSEKDDVLLRQFAVNIVDARDNDRWPTVLEGGAGAVRVLGVERVPVIIEVYPDSVTDDTRGDDGQYIEIYNPWPETFYLSGWSVKVGSATFALTGALIPNGYVIVTDDYDNARDANAADDLDGQGSFYDLFRAVSNGSSKRVVELPSFTLPHQQGSHTVELLDGEGVLIDEFVYTIGAEWGILNSFQRMNPLVRETKVLRASPFSRPAVGADSQEAAERLRNYPQDVAFTSVLELFDVFAGFAGSEGGEGSRWGFPVVASPASGNASRRQLAGDSRMMDARVVDLFTVETSERMSQEEVLAELSKRGPEEKLKSAPDPWAGDLGEMPQSLPSNPRAGSADAKRLEEVQAVAWSRYAMPPRGLRHGLINVNTASSLVLQSAGFTQLQASAVGERRRQVEGEALSGRSGRHVPYQRLSDLLVDEGVWGRMDGDSCKLVRALRPVYDHLTITSRAFLLEGQALESSDSGSPQVAGARVAALIALDKPNPEFVVWAFSY